MLVVTGGAELEKAGVTIGERGWYVWLSFCVQESTGRGSRKNKQIVRAQTILESGTEELCLILHLHHFQTVTVLLLIQFIVTVFEIGLESKLVFFISLFQLLLDKTKFFLQRVNLIQQIKDFIFRRNKFILRLKIPLA